MKIKQDEKIIDRILEKAVEDVLPSKDMLKEMLMSGKRLNIYQGFDPTAPTLHIGHAVMMRKLEDFRKLGHNVTFLMGNFTGMIGDPTDKDATRTQLTIEEVNENLKTYKTQANRIIDMDNKENPVSIKYNYDWLSKLTFEDIIDIASNLTVQQMLKRSMFQKRLEEDKPIGLHEFLYPLMQGYDSVAMETDIEVGGNDQMFNMMTGRTLVKAMLNKEKIVLTGKLLTTSEGTKMGKSEGNMIMLSDTPENMYGKVMAFTDEAIVNGFELLTDIEMEDLKEIEKRLESGENPINLKKELAFEITKDHKGEESAKKAQKQFEDVFQKNDLDTELPEMKCTLPNDILSVMVEIGFAKSKSEARRLVEQGAVSVDGEKIDDRDHTISQPITLKTGKQIGRVVD